MAKISDDGVVPQEELDEINEQFMRLGLTTHEVNAMNQAIEKKRVLQIQQTEKITALKQTEDYYYKQIQDAMAELEHIRANKDKVNMDDAM